MSTVLHVVERPVRRVSRQVKMGVREYRRAFIIETDDANIDTTMLYAAQDPSTFLKIPQYFELYPGDLSSFVRRVEIEQREDPPWMFDATVDYSSEADMQQQDENNNENPFSIPAEITVSYDRFQRVVQKDVTGKAILNSAGEPFDPPLEVESGRPVISITKNFRSFPFTISEAYQDAINIDTYLGFGPRTLRCAGIPMQTVTAKPAPYVRATLTLVVNRDKWLYSILDRGYTQKVKSGSNYIRVAITDDKDDFPVQTPQLLDGTGTPVPPGGDAVFLPVGSEGFRVHHEMAFSSLGFL